MSDLKMGTAEARFADIIWEREPITSGQMAKIGAEEFNWKKSTSHTVLRRLCERGLFKNEDGTVTRKNNITIKMSCFSPIKKSAFSAHNFTEKIIDAISHRFADNISGFSIDETQYDDDVKSYKITGLIHFQYNA